MQVRKLLERSGAPEENLEQFEKQYDEEIGAQMTVMANNISDTRKFEGKNTADDCQSQPGAGRTGGNTHD